ncbi:MAG: hypothetical protein JRJ85_05305 [Deltaproteobacteria bacterium]|nr:hypothetical protein [Deltaproteobacteria bacterium]
MDLKFYENTPPWEWPDDAGEYFLDILANDRAEASDRLLAAQLAGDATVVNDKIAKALLSIISNGDESEELRGRAAISLGPALELAYIDDLYDDDDTTISEEVFQRIQESLRELFMDADIPKEARRRILEAAVRAPQDWHREAVRTTYGSKDESWRLTAVFCMGYVRGFDEQILESLNSDNPDIHYQAVCAAGNWGLAAAWPHIAELLKSAGTDRDLLFAAIDAAVGIQHPDAEITLGDLINSDDQDIVDAAHEALAMLDGLAEFEEYEE